MVDGRGERSGGRGDCSGPSPTFLAGLDGAALGLPRRNSGGHFGRRRDRDPVCRRGRALRAAPAADLVGRAGLDPVPVAGHARRGGRVPPLRAHAHDRGGRAAPGRRRGPGSMWSRAARRWPSWRSSSGRLGSTPPKKASSRRRRSRSRYVARRGAAGRHLPDGGVRAVAAAARSRLSHGADGRGDRCRRRRLVLAGTAISAQACAPQWARSATPTTTPCARVSSQPSNASCSIGVGSRHRPKRAVRSSNSSKASTIRAAVTPRSDISRRSTTSASITLRQSSRRTPACRRARGRQGQALRAAPRGAFLDRRCARRPHQSCGSGHPVIADRAAAASVGLPQ